LRLGLCCQFVREPIKFRATTAAAMVRLPKPERHHDYISAGDFPVEWLGWPLTVEVEAKAKELAVARLIADLKGEERSHAR
jgi:UV DNA damage endonuclease